MIKNILDKIFYSKLFESQRFKMKQNLKNVLTLLDYINPLLEENGLLPIDDSVTTNELIDKVGLCWKYMTIEQQDNVSELIVGERYNYNFAKIMYTYNENQ